MSDYEKESELIAYCGIYCRLCDYFTGRIQNAARGFLEIARKHTEFKLFADTSRAFDYENLIKGLEWLSKETSPCVGGCRGGGGWGGCPIRKCCGNRELRFCYECKEFPCAALEKYPSRIEELTEIRRIGLNRWIKKNLE